MSAKILYVSSAVQAALMSQIFIPELMDGFWKKHRPEGHGEAWRDVEVRVAEPDGVLGPDGFTAPRNYNFLNLEFAIPNEARLVAVAQSAKPNSNFKSVKKELIELGRIVGARLPTRDATPTKLFRGNHKPNTVTVSSTRARMAAAEFERTGVMPVAAVQPLPIPTLKATVKKTVVKNGGLASSEESQAAADLVKARLAAKDNDRDVVVTKTSAGATVRRVAATTVPLAANSMFPT